MLNPNRPNCCLCAIPAPSDSNLALLLQVSHAEQASLENHIQVHAAALESFREMSSSLTSASIELQVSC